MQKGLTTKNLYTSIEFVERRAFSSVGRASPLQGEGQKFESSNAHHKRQDNECYPVFYHEHFAAKKVFFVIATSRFYNVNFL